MRYVKHTLLKLQGLQQIMDMMGYEPSYWNKINIHVGGEGNSLALRKEVVAWISIITLSAHWSSNWFVEQCMMGTANTCVVYVPC